MYIYINYYKINEIKEVSRWDALYEGRKIYCHTS